jgi:Na+/H+ antiporter NhaD/arsenite permease-like protein
MDFFSPFWLSISIFIITFIWILSEKVHRSLIAFAWAVIMILIWSTLWWYSFEAVGNSVDYPTLLLLWGMMVLVAVMEKTWVFEYLAIRIAKKTHWSYWRLLIALGIFTSLSSMILDNVTTIILVAPITLIITKILHFNPVPLLMSQAILSNIAWVGTLVWDPPNIIIWSAAGFHFTNFLTHALPVVIFAWIIALWYILAHCHGENKVKPKYIEKLMEIKAHKSITKPIILKKSLVILVSVIFLFFFHHTLNIPASMVALLWAACILLLVAPHDNPQKYLKKLELSVFLFFTSLFVLVWGLEAGWVLDYIANLMSQWVEKNIVLTAIILLWWAAILTAIIDNIPMTIAMVPIIWFFESQWIAGTNILWWALVFWVGFWANISPIWSSANLVVMAKLELAGKKIHNSDWMKLWVPVAFLWLSVASWVLMLFWNYFMS